jgi:hypothetical protein
MSRRAPALVAFPAQPISSRDDPPAKNVEQ